MCRWAERVLCFGVGSLFVRVVPDVVGVLLHRRAVFYAEPPTS